jgi:hypothetical protein
MNLSKYRKPITLSVLATTVSLAVVKAVRFVRSWKDGIAKSRKRIESGNKAKTAKEAVDRALWGRSPLSEECPPEDGM